MIFGHKLVYAGECPFTGARYNYCDKCGQMIPFKEDYLV